MIIYIAVGLLLLYVLIKLFEWQQLSKFKIVKNGMGGRRKPLPANAPQVLPSKGFFQFPLSMLKKFFVTNAKPDAISDIEEYEHKPESERVGIVHKLLFTKNAIEVYDYDAVSKILLDHKSYGRMLPFTTVPVLKVGDKDSVSEFTKKKAARLSGLPARMFGTTNVSFLNGDEHKRLRDLLEPSFVDVSRFGKVFLGTTLECLDLWEQDRKQNGNVKLGPYFPRLTLDMLGLCVFNHNFESLKCGEKEDSYIESYHFLMDNLSAIKNFIPNFEKLPIESNRLINKHLENLDKLTFELIEKSRERLRSNKKNDGTPSLLDSMVETELNESEMDRMNIEELRDQVILFFVAGHETTSNSLTNAMFVLAQNPYVQDKILEEVNLISKNDPNYEFSYNELMSEMPYLKAFITEGLRLYNPAPSIVPRVALKNTELCGYTIPKGTLMMLNLAASHRGEQWTDPYVFRPERWLETDSLPSRTSYVPFGGGCNTCLGNKFSLYEQHLFIAKLVRKYKVLFPDGVKHTEFPYMKGTFFTAADKDLYYKLVPRD